MRNRSISFASWDFRRQAEIAPVLWLAMANHDQPLTGYFLPWPNIADLGWPWPAIWLAMANHDQPKSGDLWPWPNIAKEG